jgi:hypothetical protein
MVQIRLLLQPGTMPVTTWALLLGTLHLRIDDTSSNVGLIHFEQANWEGDLSSSTVQLVYTPMKRLYILAETQREYLDWLAQQDYIRTWRTTDSTNIIERMEE